MLTAWANHAALVAFGLSIGVLGRVRALLTPVAAEAAIHRDRRPGEGFFEAWRNRTDEQNEVLIEARRRSAPLRYVSWAVIALIGVLILTIALSPVDLGWWWLIGSAVAGGLLAEVASRLASSGRIDLASWQHASRRDFRRLAVMVAKPPEASAEPSRSTTSEGA